jgi:hypothetical protein
MSGRRADLNAVPYLAIINGRTRSINHRIADLQVLSHHNSINGRISMPTLALHPNCIRGSKYRNRFTMTRLLRLMNWRLQMDQYQQMERQALQVRALHDATSEEND